MFATEINFNINLGGLILTSMGFIYNVYYHKLSFQQIASGVSFKNQEPIIRLPFLTLLLSFIALFVMIINTILLSANISWNFLQNYAAVLFFISLIILVQFYFFWNYPDLLKEKVQQIPIDEANPIKIKLEQIMHEQKPYKNAELSVANLSSMLDIKPYLLSKVLNEHYKKNFRDYINEYRVNEFIRLASSDEFKNYTFLALAHEVGFNSKSTFNLAFKKIKKLSPSDYIQTNQQVCSK